MTVDATVEQESPLRRPAADEAQTSLRDQLRSEIDTAQAELETRLLNLRQAGADSAILSELSSRAAALSALRRNVDSASPSALVQLQQAVASAVEASAAQSDRAEASAEVSHNSDAAYQAATNALDRKVAPWLAVDARHNDEAHDTAERYGIDLSAFDAQRHDLQKQRDQAAASGDKLGERRADVLMAQNTYDAMVAAGAGITDPAERARYDAELADQRKTVEALREAYQQQLQLTVPSQAAANGVVAERMARTSEREAALGADDHQAAVALALQIVMKASVTANTQPTDPVLPALTPENHQEVKQAAAAITASFDSFAGSLSLVLPASQIALATAPDAHTTVEVPAVARNNGGAMTRA